VAVDLVEGFAGGEERAGAGQHLDPDRIARPGYAVDGSRTAVDGRSAAGGERSDCGIAGVDQADANAGLAAVRLDQAPLDGEGADACQEIAAGLRRRHAGVVDSHLEEQIVDVDLSGGRPRDDGNLAREGMGAPDAVDLTRVGAPHDAEDQLVARCGVVRQVLGEEIRALRCPTAHEHASDPRIELVTGVHPRTPSGR
jgi:hypothetical protein